MEARPAFAVAAPEPAAAIVIDALATSTPSIVTTIVCAPAGVAAGMVPVNVNPPSPSVVTEPSVCGVEWSSTAKSSTPGARSLPTTVMRPPGTRSPVTSTEPFTVVGSTAGGVTTVTAADAADAAEVPTVFRAATVAV